MPAPGAFKPILGSFETIAEDVANQIKQVPKDVGQKALESIGITSGGTGNTKKPVTQTAHPDLSEPANDWQKFATATDEKTKKEIARNALKALLENPSKPSSEDDYAKRMKEEDQKKQMELERKRLQANSLPMPKGKPKPGFGAQQKKTSTENKAVKSD